MSCMLCGTQGPRVCDECQKITGVREMPPARRRLAPCARCNHSKLIRVIPREMSVDTGRDHVYSPPKNAANTAPMFATYTFQQQRVQSFFGKQSIAVHPPSAQNGYGLLEAYICKRCGFIDWFCQDPENIPIGPGYMTEEIDSDSAKR